MIPYEFREPLATERLRIRLMTPADTDAVHAYQSRADVCEYLLFEPRSRATVVEKVAAASAATRFEKDGDDWRLAVERVADGAVLGELYFSLARAEHQCAEIGWMFHPDYFGNGYGQESARALLRLGFETVQCHRIVAELTPQNTASVNLCRRLGMREEAYFVENLMLKGRWQDTGVYAMLRSEWNAAGD
ncbi:GNAT family N-acetyltransferase [Rathayibacter soli]|uniref:GNAT family N-acetyltransferase n=1 Tax=Rathayibacter soli TaxID=3144168 RepID=UPI0027E5620D|nr:GNAT family protein [Glaciibacter superstes]